MILPTQTLSTDAEPPRGHEDATSLDSELGIHHGELIDRFVVLERIGRGGMGIVVSAFDPRLDRKVAVKILNPSRRSGRPDRAQVATDRMLREARAMAKLSHPNVVSVYEVGTCRLGIFIAMELIVGETMSAWVSNGAQPWIDVAARFVSVGRGLAVAHDAGLVHRDVKPSNILIGADGRVCLTDFGLVSSHAASDVGSWTADRERVGTPRYMAPEQLRSEPASPRTDQFGFFVAMYEALTGASPFAASPAETRLEQIRSRAFPALPPHVPRWLRRLVERGLSPDPASRHPSMHTVVDALERGLRGRRRWWLVAGAAVVVTSSAGLGARMGQPLSGCPEATAVFQHALPGKRLESVRDRMATFGDDGATALQAFEAGLDAYQTQWTMEFGNACTAEPAPGISACLRVDLGRLEAIVTTLPEHGHKVLRLAEAIDELPAPEHCREPDDWPTAQGPRTATARRGLAKASALFDAAAFEECRERAIESLSFAESNDEPRLTVELLNQRAACEVAIEHPDRHQTLERAIEWGWGRRFPAAATDTAILAMEVAGAEGDFDRAERWRDRAQRSLALLSGRWKLEQMVAHSIARYELSRGRPIVARRLALEALGLAEEHDPRSPHHVRSMGLVAMTWLASGDIARAVSILQEARSIAKTSSSIGPTTSAVITADLAAAFTQSGDVGEARRLLLEAIDVLRAEVGPTDRVMLDARLAHLEIVEGDPAAGLERLDDALEGVGAESIHRPFLYGLRGLALSEMGRNAEAAEAFAEEVRARANEPEGLGLAIAQANLGAALLDDGRCDEALEPLETALDNFSAVASPATRSLWLTRLHWATCLNQVGRHEEVVALLEPEVERMAELFPETDDVLVGLRLELNRALTGTPLGS